MVSNVDRIYLTRRSRSRTPSRVATPQVKKSKPAKKKAPPARASTRSTRSKTPTRTITASTPKPKASAKKPTAKSTGKAYTKKRKSILADEDEDDDTDYPAKKTTSPKTPSTSKQAGRPKKSPASATLSSTNVDGKVRRSRRLQDLNTNSTLETSPIKKESKASRDLSINGGVNTSQNETLNEEQGRKWGWFSCAVM